MPYPDRFDASHLFPTQAQLRCDVRHGKSSRLAAAHLRILTAIESFQCRIDGLCTEADDQADEWEVEDAESVACILEIAEQALSSGSPQPC
jgi:hypothetical protein